MSALGKVDNLSKVRHIILVLSGKGGVGKSTVSTELALGLKKCGKKVAEAMVGILDVDLCGPSIPKMLNVDGKDIHQCSEGWVPVYADVDQKLAVMSIAFLLNSKNDAVVWRGPKKNAMIKQFLEDVYWQDLDYLVIDTPPGTSDEHITVVENIKKYNPDGAILVTTPQILTYEFDQDGRYLTRWFHGLQAVSVDDVRRELTFCKKTGVPVIGVIENMSGFVCPHCTECSNLFSKGGGEALATQFNVPFLGCIPVDPLLAKSLEEGQNFMEQFESSPTHEAINAIIQRIISNKRT